MSAALTWDGHFQPRTETRRVRFEAAHRFAVSWQMPVHFSGSWLWCVEEDEDVDLSREVYEHRGGTHTRARWDTHTHTRRGKLSWLLFWFCRGLPAKKPNLCEEKTCSMESNVLTRGKPPDNSGKLAARKSFHRNLVVHDAADHGRADESAQGDVHNSLGIRCVQVLSATRTWVQWA